MAGISFTDGVDIEHAANSSVKVFGVFKILGRFHLEPMWRPALINRHPCILNEAGGIHISERNTVSFRDVLSFYSLMLNFC